MEGEEAKSVRSTPSPSRWGRTRRRGRPSSSPRVRPCWGSVRPSGQHPARPQRHRPPRHRAPRSPQSPRGQVTARMGRGERGSLPPPPPRRHGEAQGTRRAPRPRARPGHPRIWAPPAAQILLKKTPGRPRGRRFLPRTPPRAGRVPPRGSPPPRPRARHTRGRRLVAVVPRSRARGRRAEHDSCRGARRGPSPARRRAALLRGRVEEDEEQAPAHPARGHRGGSSLLPPSGTDLGLFSPLLQIRALRSRPGSRRPRSAPRQLRARGAPQGGNAAPAHFALTSGEGHRHPGEAPDQGGQVGCPEAPPLASRRRRNLILAGRGERSPAPRPPPTRSFRCSQGAGVHRGTPQRSPRLRGPLPRPYGRRRSRGHHHLARTPPEHQGGWQGGCYAALPPNPCSAPGLIHQSSPKRGRHKFRLHDLGEGSCSLRGCSSTEPGRAPRPRGPLERPPRPLLRQKTPGRQSWGQGTRSAPVPATRGQPCQQLGSRRAARFLQRAHDPHLPAPNHPRAPL